MLLLNNKKRKLFDVLKTCFKNCNECNIAVAYVRNSEVNPIIGDLETVLKNGGRIKLISSNQMGITEQEAIESLHNIGVEIKIYTNPNKIFHPKAYIFKDSNKSEYIIGSSNLSRSALFEGVEWNVYFDNSDLSSTDIEKYFNEIWHSNDVTSVTSVTKENIDSLFHNSKNDVLKNYIKVEDEVIINTSNTFNDISENNSCYLVTKKQDYTNTWKFNLSVNKVNKLLKENDFYVIVRCDYESKEEVIFAIPSEYLAKNIFPYANQGNSHRYLFEVNKKTYRFNWQRSIKMGGTPFLISKGLKSQTIKTPLK